MSQIATDISPEPAPAVPTLPPGRRVYAIGDIHGRRDLLDLLMTLIGTDSAPVDGAGRKGTRLARQFVFLGDYVDRGPASADVLNYLIELQQGPENTVFLRGNHEQAMLDFIAEPEAMANWIDWGGAETLLSYGIEGAQSRTPTDLRDELIERLPASHFNFLLGLQSIYECQDYIFVHAGLRSDTPLENQLDRDLLWIREAFFNSDPAQWTGRCIVHGHTPVDFPEDAGWRINVDTGAVWTGMLSCVVLEGPTRRFLRTG